MARVTESVNTEYGLTEKGGKIWSELDVLRILGMISPTNQKSMENLTICKLIVGRLEVQQ